MKRKLAICIIFAVLLMFIGLAGWFAILASPLPCDFGPCRLK